VLLESPRYFIELRIHRFLAEAQDDRGTAASKALENVSVPCFQNWGITEIIRTGAVFATLQKDIRNLTPKCQNIDVNMDKSLMQPRIAAI